ncbi:hypothetical protein PMG71_16030 [Roseofilum sp. BLCC_M154]|uniref:Uncharacterized protein n=1 Tax=Roseofilum acuticapitatum BLCC-M154 TaxID=3022444 RepID=A0ABT7AVJ2_9CYAN|nr:hypothetical protein [Roseofilum acuticapitatum]MDJ1170938.1 hypothetical protein [Roseofilum acuticapitatum BLCC-M154]
MKTKYWRLAGLGAIIASLVLCVFPAWAELQRYQIIALVEALRESAPQGQTAEPLYGPWKIRPNNITRWSKWCLGESVDPEAFAANLSQTRAVLVCIVGEVLAEEYDRTAENEDLAIRRTAAWWVSGDANLYDQGDIAVYTNKVLESYQGFRNNPTDF